MEFIDGGSYNLNADWGGDSCPGIVGTFTCSTPPELNFSVLNQRHSFQSDIENVISYIMQHSAL